MGGVVLTKEDVEAFKWPESCKSDPTTSSAYLELAEIYWGRKRFKEDVREEDEHA